MSEDAGPAGFEVASAYVTVSPNADGFAEELEGEIGGLDYVVKVPVVPDTGDFAGEVDAAVADSKAAVQVPVVPDTQGFQLLLDEGTRESKAEVTVPVVPDMAGFAAAAETESAGAGEAAGGAYADAFDATLAKSINLAGELAQGDAQAAAAGEASGAAFGEGFSEASKPWLSLPVTDGLGKAVPEATAAGEAAGTGFGGALGTEAEAGAASAGEKGAASFGERFSSLLSGIPLLGGLIPGAEAESAEAGAVSGSSFMGKFKGIISGGMPAMETLLGAGFIAAAAVMSTKFQSTMELIHTQAGVAQSAISGLSGSVLALAGQVGQSPDSLAEALYHVESAFQSSGITGQKAMQMVQIAAEGARTGGANLVDVQNALDAAVVAGIPGVNNLSQAMGALNAIVGSGDMHMQDLADAMGTGAIAQAKLYGQSLTEVGAALAVFGDNNIRGAKAATDLRMTWQAIEQPLKTGDAALQHIGLTSTSLADTMTHHGLTAAIGEFIAHLQASKVPVADWGSYVTEVFGKRAGTGIGVLVEQYTRLQQKLADITNQSHAFGSAWAATQQTTAQKVHELEAGFEALMIRIGNGLMPAVDSFMGMITRNLPAIEHLGTEIAHLAAPFVTAFFTGLEAILKVLFGPLKDVTKGVGEFVAAWIALDAVMAINPFVTISVALIALVGLIIKYHKDIVETVRKYWHDIEIFLATIVLAVPFIAVLAAVIKYHQQIFDAVKDAWHAITSFLDGIRNDITGGFDSWWSSHGKEIEQVWHAVWSFIQTDFKANWDIITDAVRTGWDDFMAVFKPALALVNALWQITWQAIQSAFRTAWDVIAGIVKVAVAGIESVLKIAWDLIVGAIDVFLDLVTGHWSKAWHDAQNTAQQVWNAIKAFLESVWKAIYSAVAQAVNNLVSFLTGAWHAVSSGVTEAFNDIRNTIRNIWDGILSDIEGIVNKIKSVVSGILSLPGKVIGGAGHLLSDIGLAGGGVIPGYAPGKDSVRAMLSPGEGILVPEAVKAIGPAKIHAINAHYSRNRGAYGGIVTGYAGGGIVPSAVPEAMGAYALAGAVAGLARAIGMVNGPGPDLGQVAGLAGAAGQGYGSQGGGRPPVNVYFMGTQWPTAEQKQAFLTELSAAVGVN